MQHGMAERVMAARNARPHGLTEADLGGGAAGDQRRALDARLQDGVACRDASRRRIEDRAVQRMSQRGDQTPRAVTRQLGVGVERDHGVLRRIDNGSQLHLAATQGLLRLAILRYVVQHEQASGQTATPIGQR